MSEVIDHSGVLGPARDQGPRGTCLAFAVTAAHEHARRIGLDDGLDLSEEFLYWACKQRDADDAPGTSPDSARQALHEDGQPPRSSWPYVPDRDETEASCHPPAGVQERAVDRKGGLQAVHVSAESVADHVLEGQVVIIGLDLWPAFFDPTDAGSVDPPSAGDLIGDLHAVVVVGVDETRRLATIRNSWGALWADEGHAGLPYAALESACVGAWVVTPSA